MIGASQAKQVREYNWILRVVTSGIDARGRVRIS